MTYERQSASAVREREHVTSLEPQFAPAAAKEAFTGKSAFSVQFDDVDEFAASVPGWDIRLTQLGAGAFSGRLTFFPLGSVTVCLGMWNQPLLQQGAAPTGCLTVNRPGRGSSPVRHFGRLVEDDECFFGGPSSETEGRSEGIQFPTTLSIRLDALQEPWLTEPFLNSVRGRVARRAGLAWTNAFLDSVEWVVAAVELHPESIARPDVRASLAEQLIARVDAMGAADFPISQDRAAKVRRVVAVKRALEYISLNLTEPIRLSHLCRYARVGARALEYGFVEVVGLSPMTYVRTARLHRARQIIRSTASSECSISSIAMDCGFWHLSQFAVDYKALFGESPSITGRRGPARSRGVEHRREALAIS